MALVVTPVISICALAQPYLIKIAIDDHFAKGDFEGLTQVALMYLGVALFLCIVCGLCTRVILGWDADARASSRMAL